MSKFLSHQIRVRSTNRFGYVLAKSTCKKSVDDYAVYVGVVLGVESWCVVCAIVFAESCVIFFGVVNVYIAFVDFVFIRAFTSTVCVAV